MRYYIYANLTHKSLVADYKIYCLMPSRPTGSSSMLPFSAFALKAVSMCVFVIANLLAAFCDFGVGAGLALALTLLYSNFVIHVPTELFLWFGVLGLIAGVSPDIDIIPRVAGVCLRPILVRLFPQWKRLQKLEDRIHEHHSSFTHTPWKFISTVTCITSVVAASLFTSFGHIVWLIIIIPIVCIIYHYKHDEKPIGYDTLYWGLGTPPKVHSQSPHYEDWMDTNWIKPSLMSLIEVAVGTIGFAIALKLSGYGAYAFVPGLVAFLALFLNGFLSSVFEIRFRKTNTVSPPTRT